MVTEGHFARGLPLERLVAVCSTNPARHFGLYPRKGTIAVGSDADLVLMDADTVRQVDEADPSWSESSNFSIYQGRELRGWPTLTMLRGRVIMRARHLLGQPQGTYIRQQLGVHK